MISIAVIALLFVLIVVFCVLSAKSWHWTNIVFLILAYISAVAACVGVSKVYKGRTDALKEYSDSELKLHGLGVDSDDDGIDDYVDVDSVGGVDADGDGIADSRSGYALLNQEEFFTFGPPDSVSYSDNSLRGLTESLLLQLHGQGRVWGGSVAANGNNRTFTFPQARAAGNDGLMDMTHVVMYAFLDQVVGDTTYPTTFIGTVRVVNQTPQAWELAPVFLVQQEIFDNAGEGVTWSLYEKMPSDHHDTFTKIENVDITDESFDLTSFRAALEQKYLPASMLGFPIDSPDPDMARDASIAYERFIDRIAFDGLSVGFIEQWIATTPNRVSGDFSPDPEEIFVKYQFEKKSDPARPFLVDAVGNVENEGTFTQLGQAVDRSIHNGADVTFEVDDVVLVDSKNATGYTRANGDTVRPFNQRHQVKELDRVFYRKLNNFPLMLEKIRILTKELNEKTEVIKSDLVIAQATLDDANTQQEARDLIIGRLTDDNKNLEQDVNVIGQLLKNRQMEVNDLQAKIQALEEEIKRQRGEIQ